MLLLEIFKKVVEFTINKESHHGTIVARFDVDEIVYEVNFIE